MEGSPALVVASMYDIDDFKCGYAPSEGTMRRARAHEEGSAGDPICKSKRPKSQVPQRAFDMSLEDVFAYGTHLGHRDVTQNIRDRNTCEECGGHEGSLRMCDGCFPVAVGQSFPIGAMGRQHACHLGSICAKCILVPLKKRRTSWSIHFKGNTVSSIPIGMTPDDDKLFFLCVRCTINASNIEDVWGQNVIEGGRYLELNSRHPTQRPIVSSANIPQPFQRSARAATARAEKASLGVVSCRKSGGEEAMRAAQTFLRAAHDANMPKTTMQSMLDVFRVLHEQMEVQYNSVTRSLGHRPAVPFPSCPLARTLKTVERRAGALMTTESDVQYDKVKVSMHDVGQVQKTCNSYVSDVETALQSLLEDPRLDNDKLFMVPAGVRRDYTDEHGTKLFGPEPWHGSYWREMESAVQPGAIILAIVVHSDQTNTSQGNRYPYRISLLNTLLSRRKMDFGSRGIGFGGVMDMHRTRGSKHADVLGEEARTAKSCVSANIPALMLADLDERARHERIFNVRTGGGTIRRGFYVRVGMYASDFEEKRDILGLRGWGCPRCLGFTNAQRIRLDETPGSVHFDKYPHMCTEPLSRCATATPRTVGSHLQMQCKLLKMMRYGATQKEVRTAESACSVNPKVECQIQRLTNLLPHGPFVVHAVDLLHSFNLGIAGVAIQLADALTLKVFQPSENFMTQDDARNRVDYRLGQFPPFRDLLTFGSGWWQANDSSTGSGGENLALLGQYPLALVEDSQLIPNRVMRTRLLHLLWGVVELGRELRTPQFYLESELDSLDRKLLFITQGFRWLMDILGDSMPGNGMNRPKFHEIMAAVDQIRRFGTLQNGSCDWGERFMKHVRKADERIGRSRNNDGGDRMTTFTSSRETDNAIAALDEDTSDAEDEVGVAGVRQPGVYARSGHVIGNTRWDLMLEDLSNGKNGPAVSQSKLGRLTTSLSKWGKDSTCTFRTQTTYDETEYYPRVTSARILLPGHCVELTTANEPKFCQVLAVGLICQREPTTPYMAVLSFRGSVPELHPELPLRHLSRGSLHIIPLNRVLRRAYIVPIFCATSENGPCVRYANFFLVNTSVHAHVAGPEGRKVFLSCPRVGCGFPVQQPKMEGSLVKCPKCTEHFRWL
jgi:hypothetical protein